MNIKKIILTIVLISSLLLVACTDTKTQEVSNSSSFEIPYTETMNELGFTENLKLDKRPEKIVALSSGTVPALFKLNVPLTAIPNSKLIKIPEDFTGEILNLVHNKDFNIETVVALSPDLVILPYTNKDTYGKILTDANIPVYYVNAGHTVSFESSKQETFALIEAFAPNSKEGEEIKQSYVDLEKRIKEVKPKFEGKSVMVLQSGPPSHYIQTNKGTLGSMAEMIGFDNVYKNDESGMVLMDLEQAISYNPDIVLTVGNSVKGEEHQKIMEESFAENPDYWNSIPAIKDGQILYLPIEYVSSTGINAVGNIDKLIDLIEMKIK